MGSHWIRGLAAWLTACLAATAAQAVCLSSDTQTTPVGPGVYELAYSASRDTVYAAVSGGFSPEAPPSRIARLHPDTLEELGSFPLSYKAFGLALDDLAGRLYVGHSVDGRITVLDTSDGRPVADIVLSQRRADGKRFQHDLRSLVIDTRTRRLFAPGLSAGDSVLFAIDLDTLALIGTLEGFGFYPTGLALDEHAGRLYVSGMDGDIRVVDTRTLTVAQHWTHTGIGQPVNLAYDAVTTQLFVVDQGMPKIREWQQRLKPDFTPAHPGNRLVVLDGLTGAQQAQVPLAEHPLAIVLDSTRQRLYVTERTAGTVTQLDSRSLDVLHRWKTGPLVNSLAYDANTQRLWASVQHAPSSTAAPRSDSVARLCQRDTRP